MKNFLNPRRFTTFSVVKKTGALLVEVRLVAGLAVSLAVISVVPQIVSQAQDAYVPSKVYNVSAQPSASGTVVSITADSPLSRAQNWQDSEGYHLIFPNSVPADSLKVAGGVRVRRAGTSLEVLLQTKPGSKVSVQYEPNSPGERQLFPDSQQSRQTRLDSTPLDSSSNSRETAHTAGNWNPPMGPTSDLPPEPFPKQTAAESKSSQVEVQTEDEGLVASIFSGTSVFLVMALGLFGLIVSRKLRSRQAIVHTAETALPEDVEREDYVAGETVPEVRGAQKGDLGSSLVKSGGSAATNGSSRQSVVRMPVAGPTSLYGAYRIDQEVGKLILGQPHRMDVLASRAIDDRRAIETSLIKGVNAVALNESARRRAREALEEYGFVARQCAALLLAPDPFDRTSAARRLGEIKSEAALPFLLEGLYDSESIVRNQAVVSIGELKLPSAIGALLDIARTHPDVPSGLLSRTLSACSVEGLDSFGAAIPGLTQLGMGHDLSIIEKITHLEPSSSVEELPASCDDEQLAQALSSLESSDVQERSEALKTLTQFRVQSSVRAIARVARHDSEPNIRSIAIASLGSIDHESVFPAILISMADDTREVRASAARALNRLSFDRADAYVRVIETSDEETLRNVAQACIQAGIVSQNLDGLGSSDHRQAYETFSLICLLAKANMNEPILNAIADHSNLDVSLRAVHLLAATGQPGTCEQLRQLAVREGVCEELKTALLGAKYKLDQTKPLEEEAVEATEADSEPKFERSEVETVDDHAGSGIPFEFMPTSQPESKPESEAEVELKLDQLEL
jgi:HEAT repeat protein